MSRSVGLNVLCNVTAMSASANASLGRNSDTKAILSLQCHYMQLVYPIVGTPGTSVPALPSFKYYMRAIRDQSLHRVPLYL